MSKEPHGTLEVSKDVVLQLKSMAHNSAGFEADDPPDGNTPPGQPPGKLNPPDADTPQDSDEVSA